MSTYLTFRVPPVEVQHTLDRFLRNVGLNWLRIKVLDIVDYADPRPWNFHKTLGNFPDILCIFFSFIENVNN